MAAENMSESQPDDSFEIPSDPYEQCLNLETAGELMNARVGQIMQLIYAEEEKAEPDTAFLVALETSLRRVSRDRQSMRGDKPAMVLRMMEKYRRVLKQDATDHE